MQILTTSPGADGWDLFCEIPSTLYSENVRPFISGIPEYGLSNSAVLLKNGRAVGRIALYDPGDAGHAFFGLFESEPDESTGAELFRFAEEAAKKLGKSTLIGPMNGSTWENYRWARSLDTPFFFSEYVHQPYYAAMAVTAGYLESAGYFSQIQNDLSYDGELSDRLKARCIAAGIRIRNLDIEHFDEELEKLYPFITETFNQNLLYSPISFDAFSSKYRTQLPFLSPDWVLVAEEGKEIVGITVNFPDLFEQPCKTMIAKTLARKPGRRYAGISHVLCAELIDRCVNKGFSRLIHAYMETNNSSMNVSGRFNGEPFRHYSLFSKHL